MGFFSNLFGKKNCCLCNAEVGMISRTGIKNKEYVCSDCAKKGSDYCRLSELDKEGVIAHFELMEKQEKIYQKYYETTKKDFFPSSIVEEGIVFMDDIGMFTIIKRNDNKINHDMFRYDQVESYDYYVKMDKDQNGKEIFKEDGVRIKFCQPQVGSVSNNLAAGRQPHPYASKRDVIVVMRKKEKDYNYAENVLHHFDFIFGVHNDRKGLFNLMSKKEKQDLQAKADFLGAFGSAVKVAATQGIENAANDAELQAKIAKAQASMDTANTNGLNKYTNAANEAENSIA